MSEKEGLLRAKELYKKNFHDEPQKAFVSYGRLEIIGNHTDHQHGHCIVAGCSLGIKGAVSPSSDGLVSIASEGYGRFAFPYNDLAMKESEKGSPLSLARGVLAGLAKKGYKVGGFRAAINSDIFAGAGVSSSAAYELFVAEVENVLYNGGNLPRIELAKAGQYAENVYFGKASGLLDQCGSSFGGVQFLDFSDMANVKVEALPFPKWPLKIVLINPGASHAGLSDLYSEMPLDMKTVAKNLFGVEVLSQVSAADFYAKIFLPNVPINERQRLRALHYFEEDARTIRAIEAFKTNNMDMFLEMERASELSQMTLLHNVMIPGHYEGSPLEAINRANQLIHHGSARVMGGGLVGSIICFIDEKEFPSFVKGMSRYYSPEKIVEVSIPEIGAHEVR
jgi:galactokinase